MANQILYGDLEAGSLTLTGSNGISLTAITSSTSASSAIFTQYMSSSAGNGGIGFGIRNNYIGSMASFYPTPYGAVEYAVANTASFTTKRTQYLAGTGAFEKISEHDRTSTKEFTRGNQNFVSRRYVLTGTTVGAQNINLAVPDIPANEYLLMPDQESWNFTVRLIARKTTGLASDAFFFQGYCDNYGPGTINGQFVQELEAGSAGFAQNLFANIQFDQDNGNNNFFRIPCQSIDPGTVSWIGYIDIVANYASASARPGGAGAT